MPELQSFIYGRIIYGENREFGGESFVWAKNVSG
jgi:hypothetical protein